MCSRVAHCWLAARMGKAGGREQRGAVASVRLLLTRGHCETIVSFCSVAALMHVLQALYIMLSML